ncbi:hypothetical protein [Thermomonospora amylolytica]|uniref:hypothetical protein n=1 Tax=Thermomonospora amylolytica TaxID=1411117 RepID=UPI000E6C5FCE|nr:hypothetical protein [Thermomonospora amylolytica]
MTTVDRTATRRKKRVEKYFNKTPDIRDLRVAQAMLGGAGGAALLGLIMLASSPFLAVLLFGGAAYLGVKGGLGKHEYDKAYEKAEPKPTDREMDDLLAADLLKIEQKAMESLGLTPDDLETAGHNWDPVNALSRSKASAMPPAKRPIVVYGPSPDSGYTVGRDGIWRFQRYEVMVICPTHHHLALYRSELNLLTGGLFLEQTQEYQYAHVVSVSTVTVPAPDDYRLRRTDMDDKDKEREQERENRARAREDENAVRFADVVLRQFTVGVSSGGNTSVTVGISDKKNPENQAHLQDSGIQQTINSVRRVLRDKNGGTSFVGV